MTKEAPFANWKCIHLSFPRGSRSYTEGQVYRSYMQRLRDSNLARIMDRWPATWGHNCKYNPNEIEEAGVTGHRDKWRMAAWPMTQVREARCRVWKDWCQLSLCEPFFLDEICSLIYSWKAFTLTVLQQSNLFLQRHQIFPISQCGTHVRHRKKLLCQDSFRRLQIGGIGGLPGIPGMPGFPGIPGIGGDDTGGGAGGIGGLFSGPEASD